MHCRLLALWGVYAEHIGKLADTLCEASRRDFIAGELANFREHNDGWGYALAIRKAGSWSLAMYRSRRPMWEDEFLLPSQGRIYGIMHTRKASRGTPKDCFSAHPFPLMLSDGSAAFVAQNGGISKEGAAVLLGSHWRPCLSEVSDTLLYAMLLAQYYAESRGSPPERLLKSLVRLHEEIRDKELSKRCANTLVLMLSPNDSIALAVVRAHYSSEKERYYDLYRVDLGGSLAYASSTVAELLRRQGAVVERIESNSVIIHHMSSGEREGVLKQEIP